MASAAAVKGSQANALQAAFVNCAWYGGVCVWVVDKRCDD